MTLTFLTDHTSPQMHALAERIIRSWNEQRPDATVTLVALDHEEVRSQVGQHHSGQPVADVMAWPHSLADPDLMLNIADVRAADGIVGSYAPRFRSIGVRDGFAYFLPTSHYWWAVYYRPSVFAAAGVRAPIRMWDEMMRAFETFRAAAIAPVALGARHLCPAAAWFDYLNMRINGPEFHRALMSLQESYTDDRVRNVFECWQRLLDEGDFLDQPADQDEEEAVGAVLRGAAAMTFIGAYVADEYMRPGEEDLDFFRFPIIDPRLPVGEDSPVDGYFVGRNSASPDDAAAFLTYLGSRQVQQMTVEATNVLPTRTDVNFNSAAPHVAKGAEILRCADHLMQFYDVDTPPEMSAVGMRAFHSFVRDPSRINRLLVELESTRKETYARTTGTAAGAFRRDAGS